MIVNKERCRQIVLDDEYLPSSLRYCDFKMLGYTPQIDGIDSLLNVGFSFDPDSVLFELNLTTGGYWWLSINDEFAATRVQLKQVLNSKFFQLIKAEALKKIGYLQKHPKSGVWKMEMDDGEVIDNGNYNCFRQEFAMMKRALENPMKHIDRYIMKEEKSMSESDPYSGHNLVRFASSGYNPKYDPERLRREQSRISYRLKQLPAILKRVFPNAFDDVQLKPSRVFDDKFHICFKVNNLESDIKECDRIEQVCKLVPEVRKILDWLLRQENIHIDFNAVHAINTAAGKTSLQEGEGGGAAAAGDAGGAVGDGGGESGGEAASLPSMTGDIAGEMNSGKITTVDVLGKWDPKRGCMGKGDFHPPKKIAVPFHRWEICNGGSKRKKDKRGKDKKYYTDKGMKIITSYDDLVEAEETSKSIFVFNLQPKNIQEILDSSEIDNPRFSKQQFLKSIGNENAEYVAIFSEFPKSCLAMAVLEYGRAEVEDCYINEIQCLKKGYGKELLHRILDTQENVWLMANPEEPSSLLDYYRRPEFQLEEYVIADSIWNKPAHFFMTKTCPKEQLCQYIDKTYTKKLSESEPGSTQNQFDFEVDDLSSEEPEWQELKPEQIVKCDDAYLFGYDFPKNEKVYKYSAHIESLNKDPELEYDDQVTSDHPLSTKEIFDKLWPEAARRYHISSHMPTAHRLLNQQLEDIKRNASSEEEFVTKLRTIAFPEITDLFYGDAAEDGIHIVPNEELFKMLTDKQIPAGYVDSEETTEIKFNKYATDKIYIEMMIGKVSESLQESKEVKEMKNKLKEVPTEKMKKQKVILKKVEEEPSDAISKYLPKRISFPKGEQRKLSKQNRIVTTRVDSDFDKFQLGDVVLTPWKAYFKVVGRRVVTEITKHPFYSFLTPTQREQIKAYDKMAVLVLDKVDR